MRSLLVSGADGVNGRLWNLEERPEPLAPPEDLELRLPEDDGLVADLFGVPRTGLRRVPPAETTLCFLLELRAEDCPMGAVSATYFVSGEGWIRRNPGPPGAVPEGWTLDNRNGQLMVVDGAYLDLLMWFHGDFIFGNVLFAGADVRGDLIDFAALDGIVSARALHAPESALVERLIDLVRRSRVRR